MKQLGDYSHGDRQDSEQELTGVLSPPSLRPSLSSFSPSFLPPSLLPPSLPPFLPSSVRLSVHPSLPASLPPFYKITYGAHVSDIPPSVQDTQHSDRREESLQMGLRTTEEGEENKL